MIINDCNCGTIMATPLNTNGMGNVMAPDQNNVGSGDIPLPLNSKKKKHKMKSLKKYIKDKYDTKG